VKSEQLPVAPVPMTGSELWLSPLAAADAVGPALATASAGRSNGIVAAELAVGAPGASTEPAFPQHASVAAYQHANPVARRRWVFLIQRCLVKNGTHVSDAKDQAACPPSPGGPGLRGHSTWTDLSLSGTLGVTTQGQCVGSPGCLTSSCLRS
jgi:hypothetical protein